MEQGSLEVLDPTDGAILAVLSKGDFFGGLPPLHHPTSISTRGSRGLPPGLALRGLVAAKSRFIVRALTYCDLHYVERDEFASLLLSYPEFVDNLVAHFELTMPLAGSGRFFTEAVSFALNFRLRMHVRKSLIYDAVMSKLAYLCGVLELGSFCMF